VQITHDVTDGYPSMPSGAHEPASSVAHLSDFASSNDNIGCQLSSTGARCDIASRSWSPPTKPGSCQLAWGQGLAIGSSGGASFVCAGDSVLDPAGQRLEAGVDDIIDSLTCQVRTFGITCFNPQNHGFFVSRTGYYTF
jgi:hypothetical protein